VTKRQSRKTPVAIENKVIEVENSTGLGPTRLSCYLKLHEGISIPPGMARHIIRRNKKRINYYPRVRAIKSEADLLRKAMGYIYYYNNVREHSALNYHTPFPFLKTQLPDVDDKIRFVIPIMLDKVSVKLGP